MTDKAVETSETSDQPQEKGQKGVPTAQVASGTSLQPTSEGGVKAQEQPRAEVSQKPETQQLDVDEQVRRRVQSELDRVVHQTRMQVRQELRTQQTQQALQQQIEGMGDEEYGRFIRQNQRTQIAFRQQTESALAGVYQQLTERALATISSQDVREGIAQRNSRGEFKTFQDFLGAIQAAEIDHQVGKARTRLEADIREAVAKDLGAEGYTLPQLGAGLPTQSVDFNKLSPTEKIAAGLVETQRKQRQR